MCIELQWEHLVHFRFENAFKKILKIICILYKLFLKATEPSVTVQCIETIFYLSFKKRQRFSFFWKCQSTCQCFKTSWIAPKLGRFFLDCWLKQAQLVFVSKWHQLTTSTEFYRLMSSLPEYFFNTRGFHFTLTKISSLKY